jgi:hypothetical protein
MHSKRGIKEVAKEKKKEAKTNLEKIKKTSSPSNQTPLTKKDI